MADGSAFTVSSGNRPFQNGDVHSKEIPKLEGPYMDMKYIVQSNRAVAKKLRDDNKELVLNTKVCTSIIYGKLWPCLHVVIYSPCRELLLHTRKRVSQEE